MDFWTALTQCGVSPVLESLDKTLVMSDIQHTFLVILGRVDRFGITNIMFHDLWSGEF